MRRAFTLVEMLVVITLISMLFAITVPAVLSARESGRAATCKNNLRQIFMGLSNHADRKNDRMCTGNFDWVRDGAVTEVGWVADCVSIGTLPGKMLCPSNEPQLSRTFSNLFNADAATVFSPLSNKLGSPEGTYPDTTPKVNPCRRIMGAWSGGGAPMATGAARRDIIVKEILEPGYNTNFAASWWLVRGGLLLDANGNLNSSTGSGNPTPADNKPALERHFTSGPLNRAKLDRSGVASSIIPLLGDAQPSIESLTVDVGSAASGSRLTLQITGGPVQPATMEVPPNNGDPTPYATWWPIWRATLQDYRQFGTPHARSAQIVFADGSVRTFIDTNKDDMLNNGFPASAISGFTDDVVEVSKADLFSSWQMKIE